MNNLEKSYLEIKVTFLHIVILLIGVVLIGIFLFYMGYQAGKSATKNQDLTTEMTRAQGNSKEIRILDNNKKNKKQTPLASGNKI